MWARPDHKGIRDECSSVAIRLIAAGGVHVMPGLVASIVMQLHCGLVVARHTSLPARGLEIARQLAGGGRPTDIAEALHLSVRMVGAHRSRILERLELSSLAALMRYRLEHGLLA